jgi:hypothetical protein
VVEASRQQALAAVHPHPLPEEIIPFDDDLSVLQDF